MKAKTGSFNITKVLPSKDPSQSLKGEELDDTGHHYNTHGLSIFVTALFIAGEQLGGGIVSVPKAVANMSWYGIPIVALSAVTTAYAGFQLGAAWIILQKRWPEYRKQTRKPYPAIAERAFGPWAGHLVSGSVFVTLFGVSIVYILIASENIEQLLKSFEATRDIGISYCHLVLIVAACLTPLTLLGTPADFWPIAVISLSTSVIASVMLPIGMAMDIIPSTDESLNSAANFSIPIHDRYPFATYSEPTFVSFFLGYGAVTFAYAGGHASYPTFQHDMKSPRKFWQAVLLAHSVIGIAYVPLSTIGLVVYGDSVENNVIANIQTPWITLTINIAITVHLVISFIIVVNAPCQTVEDVVGIPHHFGWKRVVLRILIVLMAVFIAESVPSFGVILDLVGSTTITLNAFILPGLFLLALKLQRPSSSNRTEYRENGLYKMWTIDEKQVPHSEISSSSSKRQEEDEQDERASIFEWIASIFVMLFGVCGGVAGTYAALSAIGEAKFGLPCYLSTNHSTSHNV